MTTTSTIIMAGGLGTRMRSQKPKVLHDLCGLPMLAWVVAAAEQAGADDVVAVVSPPIADEVAAAFPGVQVAIQDPANGTGHAVEVGLAALAGRAEQVLVLSGDTPAIRAETVRAVREAGSTGGVAGALAVAQVAPPHAYGRVVRSGATVERIVEARDASPDELGIAEINVGIYCFRAAALEAALALVEPHNAQGERYLTDAVALLEGPVVAVDEVDVASCAGINSMLELAAVDDQLRRRLLDEAMLAGVRIVDPANTWIDRDVHARARQPDRAVLPAAGRHVGRGGRRRRALRRRVRSRDRSRLPGRAVRLPASRHGAARAGRRRALRRAQGRRDRQRLEGAASLLPRRRDRRHPREHRRGDDHRELRRAREAPHRDRGRRPHEQQLRPRRAGSRR